MFHKIENKYSKFNYELFDNFIAGIVLTGIELAKIKQGKVNFTDSCYIYVNYQNEVYIKNLYIDIATLWDKNAPYKDRKLLLNKFEINKIKRLVQEKKFSIVPVNIFIDEKSRKIKLTIALARGKKLYNKKNAIKERDILKESNRELKNF